MDLQLIFNVPNIIDYLRIILLFFAITQPDNIFSVSYIISSSLDFFDGHAARAFNQCSVLGGCLDMIIDRISTVIIGLRMLKKNIEYYSFVSFYILIDLLSHFVHFTVSCMTMSHHKNNTNVIMQIYYNKFVLFPICLLSEAFFISAIVLEKKHRVVNLLQIVCWLKTFFHIVQLLSAIMTMSDIKMKLN